MPYTTWMNDNAATLGSKSLSQLVLPGTHDSGTYAYSGMIAPDDAVLATIEAALGLVGLVTWEALLGWTITQDRTFAQQLSDGIRYLDVRTYNNGGTLQIVHGVMPPCPKVIVGSGSGNAKGVVQDIRDFVKGRPREIVVVDFQEFQDMDSAAYTTLFDAIQSELGPYLLGPTRSGGGKTLNATLTSLWGTNPTNGQVIVLFDRTDATVMDGTGKWSSLYWDRGTYIGSPWANTDDTNTLKNFLYMENPRHLTAAGMFAVLQGQLTTISNVNFSSLSSAAADSNPKLISWLNSGALGSQWNVVIADFFDNVAYVSTLVGFNTGAWPTSTDGTVFWGGNVPIGNLAGLNKQVGIAPNTDQGLTAAVMNDVLYFFLRGPTSERLHLCSYDVTLWEGDTTISAITETVDGPPGVATYTHSGAETLLVMYKAQDHDTLRFTTFNGTTWANAKTVDLDSSHSPALATFTDADGTVKVMVAYKDNDTDDLKYATLDVASGGWTNHGKIKNAGDISPQSDKAPALAVYQGKMYMVYKGANSNTLWLSVYTISTGKWSGNTTISDQPGGIDPASDETPSLAVFGGKLMLVYTSANVRRIYEASFDGTTWTGNDMITDTPNAAIDPNTNKSPALASYGQSLFLLYKGAHSDTVYAASKSPFHTLRD